jgi:hypothetical protein
VGFLYDLRGHLEHLRRELEYGTTFCVVGQSQSGTPLSDPRHTATRVRARQEVRHAITEGHRTQIDDRGDAAALQVPEPCSTPDTFRTCDVQAAADKGHTQDTKDLVVHEKRSAKDFVAWAE